MTSRIVAETENDQADMLVADENAHHWMCYL